MKELMQKIGTQATYRQEPGFDVAVIIEDVRKAFGRIDYQIRPVTGAGIKWVSSDRISEENAWHDAVENNY